LHDGFVLNSGRWWRTVEVSSSKTSEILVDIVKNNLSTADTEIELIFAVVKIKHRVVRKRKE